MDHEDVRTARYIQQARKLRERVSIHREVDTKRPECAAGLDEIALHVDEQQRCVRWVDKLDEVGEDLFSFNGYQRSVPRGVPPRA
jgi:hypothetical protein